MTTALKTAAQEPQEGKLQMENRVIKFGEKYYYKIWFKDRDNNILYHVSNTSSPQRKTKLMSLKRATVLGTDIMHFSGDEFISLTF